MRDLYGFYSFKEGFEAFVNQPVAILTETKDENIKDYEPEGIELQKTSKEEKDDQKEKRKVEKGENQRA